MCFMFDLRFTLSEAAIFLLLLCVFSCLCIVIPDTEICLTLLKKKNIDTLQGSCSSLSQEAVSCYQDSQCIHAALPWPKTGLFHLENVAKGFGDCCSSVI